MKNFGKAITLLLIVAMSGMVLYWAVSVSAN